MTDEAPEQLRERLDNLLKNPVLEPILPGDTRFLNVQERFNLLTAIMSLLPSAQGKDGGERNAVNEITQEEVKAIRAIHDEAELLGSDLYGPKEVDAWAIRIGPCAHDHRGNLLNLLGDKEGWRDQIRREAFEEAAKLIDGKGAFINRDVTSRQIRALKSVHVKDGSTNSTPPHGA